MVSYRKTGKSVIFPIEKKTASTSVDNLRPINITRCICRELERIIRDSTMKFLYENQYIKQSQHGFLSRKSASKDLISYSNKLSNALDHGMCIDTVYFDFSKAFDCVRHDFHIQKLIKLRISGSLLKWIIDYFRNRTQFVNINGFLSPQRHVSSTTHVASCTTVFRIWKLIIQLMMFK